MKHQEWGTAATEPERSAAIPTHIEPPRRVTSASLLQGHRQIVIEHVGREYRLRLTSKGKLILTG
jgi:hemin uptake protein HemP